MRLFSSKLDIGLIWAKYLAIWSQIAVVAGTVQNLMTMGIFYFTVIKYVTDFPLWLYILIILLGIITVITFILKIGISGHYRFFSDQSRITEMENRLDRMEKAIDKISKKLGIEDEN